MEPNDDDNQLREILLEYHGDQNSASNDLVEEIDNMCRTCLKKSPEADLRSMFEEYTYIPVFLMSFAAVETPTVNDRLPRFICIKCIDQVNQIYNFRKQIETADLELRRIISECNSDDEGLIEEQLVTEDYTNLDDIDMDDILSASLPIFASDKKIEEDIIEEEKKADKNLILTSHVCDTCQMTFETLELLEVHRKDTHTRIETPKITCKHCTDTFVHQFDYNLHQSLHSDTCFCSHCKKDCGNRKSLKRHIAIHFKDKPYKCPDCQHQFAEKASLNRHKKQHLGVQRIKKFHCDSCQQQFYDKHTLEIHIRSKHTGVKPFSCPQCEKSFADKRLLKSHVKVHTDVKNYVCSVCNQAFKHRNTLVGHVRTHTSDRPFLCEICNVAFKQKSHLSTHLIQHTGKKPYSCKICEKRFTASNSLKVHERTHTGQKPYQCEICKKQFSRKDLRVHYATHTGQKDFICTEDGCDKSYATQSLLNMHRKMKHSDANPFVCTYAGCDKRFLSDINLKKHLKAHERKKQNQKIEGVISGNQDSTMNLFPNEGGRSLALCVMDELDQFMKQHQQQFNTTKGLHS